MVNRERRLNEAFGALADPTRRAIIQSLARGGATVSELAEPHRMSLPAVLKHLRVLERAGLVQRKKEGRVSRCRLATHRLKEASDWLTQYEIFWEERLDALGRYLAGEKKPES